MAAPALTRPGHRTRWSANAGPAGGSRRRKAADREASAKASQRVDEVTGAWRAGRVRWTTARRTSTASWRRTRIMETGILGSNEPIKEKSEYPKLLLTWTNPYRLRGHAIVAGIPAEVCHDGSFEKAKPNRQGPATSSFSFSCSLTNNATTARKWKSVLGPGICSWWDHSRRPDLLPRVRNAGLNARSAEKEELEKYLEIACILTWSR
jgi:hypothetical protein